MVSYEVFKLFNINNAIPETVSILYRLIGDVKDSEVRFRFQKGLFSVGLTYVGENFWNHSNVTYF